MLYLCDHAHFGVEFCQYTILIVSEVPILVILLLKRMSSVRVESAADNTILINGNTSDGTAGIVAHVCHVTGVSKETDMARGEIEVRRRESPSF